jgi:hypothetical protein
VDGDPETYTATNPSRQLTADLIPTCGLAFQVIGYSVGHQSTSRCGKQIGATLSDEQCESKDRNRTPRDRNETLKQQHPSGNERADDVPPLES